MSAWGWGAGVRDERGAVSHGDSAGGGPGWERLAAVWGESDLWKTVPLPVSKSEPGKVPRRIKFLGLERKTMTAAL